MPQKARLVTATLGATGRNMERELWPGLDRWVCASETTNRPGQSRCFKPLEATTYIVSCTVL